MHVTLVDAVKAKERETWGVDTWDGTLAALADASLVARFGDRLPPWMAGKSHSLARPQPYLRVMDHDLELMRMLYEVGGFACLPAQKQEKQLRIQRLRAMVMARQVKIHPRCVHTLRHLRQTTWKDHQRREWARKGGEHGDLIDCLSYMVMDLNRDSPIARKLLARRLLGR